MADPLRKADRRYTYNDYASWSDEERWELIDGVAYDMSPAPSPRHQSVLGELHAQFHATLRGSPCRAYLAPFDVRLPDGAEEDELVSTVVQPDLLVICDAAKVDTRGCRGAPDLLVEILSPSTAYKDQTAKQELYERHGVREYWIVNPERAMVMVYRLGAEGRYARPVVFLDHETIQAAAVPGLRVSLTEVFAG